MKLPNIEKRLAEIAEYITEAAESKPNIYSCTRERYRNIANSCQTIISGVSEILQSEIQNVTEEEEFETMPDANVQETIENMLAKILRLNEFCGDSKPNTTNVTHKEIFESYLSAIAEVREESFEMPAVQTCCDLLTRWIEKRFLGNSAYSNFKYSMTRVPRWFTFIVIAYANNLEIHNEDVFVSMFTKWCDSLSSNSQYSKYAVPYDVFSLCTKQQVNVSITALALWDILVDKGLHKICTIDMTDEYPTEDAVYQVCLKNDDKVIDKYIKEKENNQSINRFGGDNQ